MNNKWWSAIFVWSGGYKHVNIFAPTKEHALWLAEDHPTIFGIWRRHYSVVIGPAGGEGPSLSMFEDKIKAPQ